MVARAAPAQKKRETCRCCSSSFASVCQHVAAADVGLLLWGDFSNEDVISKQPAGQSREHQCSPGHSGGRCTLFPTSAWDGGGHTWNIQSIQLLMGNVCTRRHDAVMIKSWGKSHWKLEHNTHFNWQSHDCYVPISVNMKLKCVCLFIRLFKHQHCFKLQSYYYSRNFIKLIKHC